MRIMGNLQCKECNYMWDGEQIPTCPSCQASMWNSVTGMLRPKHDPQYLPSAYNRFRSVMASEFREQSQEYYRHISYSGTALWSNIHGKPFYVAGVPSHLHAGSAVYSGNTTPSHALDAYIIADPFGSAAHIYAEKEQKIQDGLVNHKYERLSKCATLNCNNCCVYGYNYCAKHLPKPLAT